MYDGNQPGESGGILNLRCFEIAGNVYVSRVAPGEG